MRRARIWADQLFHCDIGTADIDDVRRIQADALRFAANLSGPLHRVHVLTIADALERIASGMELEKDRELENSL